MTLVRVARMHMISRTLKARGQTKSLVPNIGWGPCLLRIDHKESVLYMYSNSITIQERVQLVECGSKMQVVIYAGEWHPFATLLHWVSKDFRV